MKGDFSRQTFDPKKHYSTVRMQQGRVQLDADWNEQADLALYRAEAETANVIGGCGGPHGDAAFELTLVADLDAGEREWLKEHYPSFAFEAGDFVLSPGRYYVDGVLCECEQPVPYTKQADLADQKAIDVKEAGLTIVYLDVWQRHLTWLDDPTLRESALGGADTATRTKTVWQVRTLPVGAQEKASCAEGSAKYRKDTAPSAGRLQAREKREDHDADPCEAPEEAGYRGLENQLYRVEIHAAGEALDLDASPTDVGITLAPPAQVVYEGDNKWDVGKSVEIFRAGPGHDPMEGWLATIVGRDVKTKTLTLNASLPDLDATVALRMRAADATYKWSRDNGSLVTEVGPVEGSTVHIARLAPDQADGFQVGNWVELIDEVTELKGEPGFLSQIESVDLPAKTVSLRGEPLTKFDGKPLKLRHWDGAAAAKRNPKPAGKADPFVELEDGVQVAFSEGSLHSGDHWLIPARAATTDKRLGTVEWPIEEPIEKKTPLPQLPFGIRHRYCVLAILKSDGKKLELAEDCRSIFPPLTQLDTLVYVGGDGQEVLPGKPLPQPLEAGVFRGPLPVKGAKVLFTALDGGAVEDPESPAEQPDIELTTGEDGVVACIWKPDPDPDPDPERTSQRVEARLLDADGKKLAPKLEYNAQLSVASQVAYEPGECAGLEDVETVQEALDELCRRPTGGGDGCCQQVEPGERIDEILPQMIKEGHRSICLCLREGDYHLGGLHVLSPAGRPTITIMGAGPLTKLKAEGAVVFQDCDMVRIADLELRLHSDGPLELTGCGSVVLERCKIVHDVVEEKRGQPPKKIPGLACVIDSDKVLVTQSSIDCGDDNAENQKPALALESKVQRVNVEVLIDFSEILGSLVVGGRSPAEFLIDKQLGLLAKQASVAKLLGPVIALYLRNSRLSRFALDQDALQGIRNGVAAGILREFKLTDTTVSGFGNLAVARHAVLSGVGFESSSLVGGVAADTAIVSSSWGPSEAELKLGGQRSAGAANLIQLIDAESGGPIG